MQNQLINAYQKLYALTMPACRNQCRAPRTCCSPEYCEETIRWAQESWGTKLSTTEHPTLPLMGPDGCTAAPHFRPMCTAHVCKINGMGTSGDPEWDQQYFELTDLVNNLEFERLNP